MSQQLPATLPTAALPPVLITTREPEAIVADRELVLRHARDGDAAAIVALIGAVWSEYPGKTLVAADDMPELLAPASAYRAWGGAFWVVEAPGPIGAQIIGTIALRDSARPRVVELQKLYVARRARNNGVGGFLCGLVERAAWARGARTVELWSDVKLHEAHCCYEGRGYVRGGELKTYDDTSATVRFYYRKELDASTPDPLPGCNPSRDPGPWRVRVRGWERAHAGPGELRPAGA